MIAIEYQWVSVCNAFTPLTRVLVSPGTLAAVDVYERVANLFSVQFP